ncbi:MAG TPA: peptidoglycan-binding protein [Planctomycetota bacterium]|nr:peptidoglycan-binding protein [Planctomycetota bacterium]
MGKTIVGSVGSGGINGTKDTMTIQYLLNCVPQTKGGPMVELVVDGILGPKTIAAIKAFQKANLPFADGRVDPGKQTFVALQAYDPQPNTPINLGGPKLSSNPAAKEGAGSKGLGYKDAAHKEAAYKGAGHKAGYKEGLGYKDAGHKTGYKEGLGYKDAGHKVGGYKEGVGYKDAGHKVGGYKEGIGHKDAGLGHKDVGGKWAGHKFPGKGF